MNTLYFLDIVFQKVWKQPFNKDRKKKVKIQGRQKHIGAPMPLETRIIERPAKELSDEELF